MFDFFFDTADEEYILKTWDKVSKYMNPTQIRGITTP